MNDRFHNHSCIPKKIISKNAAALLRIALQNGIVSVLVRACTRVFGKGQVSFVKEVCCQEYFCVFATRNEAPASSAPPGFSNDKLKAVFMICQMSISQQFANIEQPQERIIMTHTYFSSWCYFSCAMWVSCPLRFEKLTKSERRRNTDDFLELERPKFSQKKLKVWQH